MLKNIPKLETYLLNEINGLQNTTNPNIVKLKDIMQDTQYYYFVYEFCNSGDLRSYLKKY